MAGYIASRFRGIFGASLLRSSRELARYTRSRKFNTFTNRKSFKYYSDLPTLARPSSGGYRPSIDPICRFRNRKAVGDTQSPCSALSLGRKRCQSTTHILLELDSTMFGARWVCRRCSSAIIKSARQQQLRFASTGPFSCELLYFSKFSPVCHRPWLLFTGSARKSAKDGI